MYAKVVMLFPNKHFRNFILADAVLDIGRKISWIALSWFVYQTTGSVVSLGTVLTVAMVWRPFRRSIRYSEDDFFLSCRKHSLGFDCICFSSSTILRGSFT
jgi:hypothetical protein